MQLRKQLERVNGEVYMKYIASCSFGKDSLAMILKLLENKYPLDEVVYFDIGAEFNSLYKNKELIKEKLNSSGVL